MHLFLTYTIFGLVAGAAYAVTATGLVVTYTTTGIFNFGHGAVGMIAAYSYWDLVQVHQTPVWLALLLVLFVEAPILAAVVEWGLMRRLHGASTDRILMVTIGLMLLLFGLAQKVGSWQVTAVVPQLFSPKQITFDHVQVEAYEIVILVFAVVVAAGLWAFLRWVRLGVAMRAVVDDPELLAMAGSPPVRVARFGWMVGFLLAAAAGILLAMQSGSGLSPDTLTLLVVNAFAAALFGKLRNLPLTFVGGIVLGLITGYISNYWDSWPGNLPNILQNVDQIVPVVVLFIVLVFLPQDRLRAVGRVAVAAVPKVASLRQSLTGAGAILLLTAILALAVSGQSLLQELSSGFVFGLICLSLVLLTGYAGQVSLCQVTFAGVGSYVMVKVGTGGSWEGIVLAVVVSSAVGILVALPTLRLRGLFLALSTLAFGQIAYYAYFSNSNSFVLPSSPSISVPAPFTGEKMTLILCGVLFSLAAVGLLALRRSTFGRRLVAMSDSPAACATVGLSVTRSKVAVFAIAGGLAGLAGALYGSFEGSVGSASYNVFVSLVLLLLLSIWGIRTISGALIAGFTMAFMSGPSADIIVGVGIFVSAALPNGIMGSADLVARYLPLLRSQLPGSLGGGSTPPGAPPAVAGTGVTNAEGPLPPPVFAGPAGVR
jgi:branched-chain amino acid transport system permease protein